MPVVFAVVEGVVVAVVVRPIDRVLAMARRRETFGWCCVGKSVRTCCRFFCAVLKGQENQGACFQGLSINTFYTKKTGKTHYPF